MQPGTNCPRRRYLSTARSLGTTALEAFSGDLHRRFKMTRADLFAAVLFVWASAVSLEAESRSPVGEDNSENSMLKRICCFTDLLVFGSVRLCADGVLSAHWRGVHVHQRPGPVSVDQAEVRDSWSDAVHSRGEEDAAGPHDPLHQVGSGGPTDHGPVRHHPGVIGLCVPAGLRSFFRRSGPRRNASDWRDASP